MKFSYALFCILAIALTQVIADTPSLDAVPTFPAEPAAVTRALESEDSAVVPAAAALVETAAQASVESPLGRRGNVPGNVAADKLDVALQAIKQDILVRNRQIHDEKHWVRQVRKIVDTYDKKMKRVVRDIKKTRHSVRDLFRKKKQIENLKIQRELEKKLTDATADLGTLASALHHVHTKEDEFSKTKSEIKRTILNIQLQLAKLKGDHDPKKIAHIHEKVHNM